MTAVWFRHVRANAVGYLALFIALGGTSYAAVQLPRNSVGKAQIKNNAVTSAKVKNGSLAAADLSKGARASLRGKAGPQGPVGPEGAPGLSSGPAGGDLSGNYPNPAIAAGAVGASKLAAVPTVRLGLSQSQAIASTAGDTSPVAFDVEVEDAFAMHDAATPSQVVAPIAGLYLVTLQFPISVDSNGIRIASARNPDSVADRAVHVVENATSGAATFLSGTGVARLAAGQRLEFVVGQNSGSSLNLIFATAQARVTWIGN